jgi:hypothetical protein
VIALWSSPTPHLDSVGFSQEQEDEKNSMDVKSVSENWKTTQNEEERERETQTPC